MRATSTRLRWLFACGGVTCVALGAVGAFVPGLPTTVFVLCGSYLLARSAPTLDERLRKSALFSPYVKYLDPSVPMPRAARMAALVSMWMSISVSAAALRLSGAGTAPAMAIVAGGVAGTWMILVFRRGPSKAADGHGFPLRSRQ